MDVLHVPLRLSSNVSLAGLAAPWIINGWVRRGEVVFHIAPASNQSDLVAFAYALAAHLSRKFQPDNGSDRTLRYGRFGDLELAVNCGVLLVDLQGDARSAARVWAAVDSAGGSHEQHFYHSGEFDALRFDDPDSVKSFCSTLQSELLKVPCIKARGGPDVLLLNNLNLADPRANGVTDRGYIPHVLRGISLELGGCAIITLHNQTGSKSTRDPKTKRLKSDTRKAAGAVHLQESASGVACLQVSRTSLTLESLKWSDPVRPTPARFQRDVVEIPISNDECLRETVVLPSDGAVNDDDDLTDEEIAQISDLTEFAENKTYGSDNQRHSAFAKRWHIAKSTAQDWFKHGHPMRRRPTPELPG